MRSRRRPACAAGSVRELPSTEYRDNKDRPKLVRYWLMEVDGGDFKPNDEVDEVRWLGLEEASATLTYQRDRELLASV